MTDAFETHRQFLVGVAYRMLGSIAEAEDVVQDAFLRWRDHTTDVADPRAYLATVVTRLCLDLLKSARARREEYVGTWLPEPLVEEPGPMPGTEVADDVSVALMLTLERLSPLERAAFLLHDVFDVGYAQIAVTLERSEAACRQLVARAREHVRDARPRFARSPDAEQRLVSAFAAAMLSGQIDALSAVLAKDAVLYSDGGGKRKAALNPIYGRDRILRFLTGIQKKSHTTVETARPARINGLPGFVLRTEDGLETLALELRDDAIAAIYLVRNPDKLRHVALS
jgi:RNA polymerase sigma-70 factor (ECF subfamily)